MNRRHALLLLGQVLASAPLFAAGLVCTTDVAPMQFGPYTPGQGSNLDSVATLRLACSNDGAAETVGYRISLSAGASGNPAERHMQMDGEVLRYNIYLNAARTVVLGDGGGGSSVITGSLALPASRTAQHLAYGRLPARQSPWPGIYTDQLLLSIEY